MEDKEGGTTAVVDAKKAEDEEEDPAAEEDGFTSLGKYGSSFNGVARPEFGC